MPYKDLSTDEILSATVQIPPQGFHVALNGDEIAELTAILRTIEIGEPDYETETVGEPTVFTLLMANGAEEGIWAYSNLISLSGKDMFEPHKTETGYILSELGQSIAEDAYLLFLEKCAGSSVLASPDAPSRVAVGWIVIIRLDETQSVPYRWKPDISDAGLAVLVHDGTDAGIAVPNGPPGSGGEARMFYFEALRAGECTITMNYTDIRDDGMITQTITYSIIIGSE